jgi:hypothetical protein
MLALLNRVAAEATAVRERLLALTDELDAAAQQLHQHFGPRLAAVAAAPPLPPDPTSPPVQVAVEMAVAGFSRGETHARLTNDFAIADPRPILDEVFGAA